jgi:nicotinamidase-related amidase
MPVSRCGAGAPWCTSTGARGRDVVRLIEPDLDRDYFMFKPKHSAFFGTPLESLLRELGIRRLVLTGITSHQCVLFTAMDAHVREYELLVPADCVGAGSREETRHALFIAEHALRARVAGSARLRFAH